MISSCDVGSIPFVGDLRKFVEGASHFSLSSADESAEYQFYALTNHPARE